MLRNFCEMYTFLIFSRFFGSTWPNYNNYENITLADESSDYFYFLAYFVHKHMHGQLFSPENIEFFPLKS